MKQKYARESLCVKTDLVLPNDTNNHNTLFGGALMAHIDTVAAISAQRHCRAQVVTASTDSVDFLCPIKTSDSICLESYVTWTGKTSMEIFVKVVAEDLLSGERKVAATSFLTFVCIDKIGNPLPVPQVIPESEEEKELYRTAPDRQLERLNRRKKSKELAAFIKTVKPWEN
jgi:acyl-CoA hydrolase